MTQNKGKKYFLLTISMANPDLEKKHSEFLNLLGDHRAI